MKELTSCPYCQGDFEIREVECQCCHTQIKGSFRVNRFHRFDNEDLLFIELFLKNEGNIKLMEKDLGISYPTVKNRLKGIVSALGYQAEEESPKRKLSVLEALSEGKINVKEALASLGESK